MPAINRAALFQEGVRHQALAPNPDVPAGNQVHMHESGHLNISSELSTPPPTPRPAQRDRREREIVSISGTTIDAIELRREVSKQIRNQGAQEDSPSRGAPITRQEIEGGGSDGDGWSDESGDD